MLFTALHHQLLFAGSAMTILAGWSAEHCMLLCEGVMHVDNTSHCSEIHSVTYKPEIRHQYAMSSYCTIDCQSDAKEMTVSMPYVYVCCPCNNQY